MEGRGHGHGAEPMVEAEMKAVAIPGPVWLNVLISPRLWDTSFPFVPGMSPEEALRVQGPGGASTGTLGQLMTTLHVSPL